CRAWRLSAGTCLAAANSVDALAGRRSFSFIHVPPAAAFAYVASTSASLPAREIDCAPRTERKGARKTPRPLQPYSERVKAAVYLSTLSLVMRTQSKSCFSELAPVEPVLMKLSAWRTASAAKTATGCRTVY